MACGKKNYFAALIWLALLWIIVWPIALFCSFFWIILQPFEALFPFVKMINEMLERLITWPRDTGKAIRDCSSTCPNPF